MVISYCRARTPQVPRSHDAEEKTLKFLYDSARRACLRVQQKKTLDALTAPKHMNLTKPRAKPKTTAKGALAPAAKSRPQVVCQFWRQGTCKFGDGCTHVHWKDQVHTPSKAWPAGTTITLSSQPRDKCRFFADSKCNHGDMCIYKYGEDDGRDLPALLKERRESEARNFKGKGKGDKSGGKMLLRSTDCTTAKIQGGLEEWVLDTGSGVDASGRGIRGTVFGEPVGALKTLPLLRQVEEVSIATKPSRPTSR